MRLFQPKSLFLAACLFGAAAPLLAQAPAGTTGSCVDGTFTSAASKSGACSGHGGVKTWRGPATVTVPVVKPAPVDAPTVTAKAPAGATGTCGDGSFTTAKLKSGACSSHGGVKSWYAATPPAPTMAPPAAKPTMAAPAPTATPRGAAVTAPPAAKPVIAPAPAGAPATATALCTDGTYSMTQHRSGTCSGHKGVKQWLKDIPAH
jgi:Protein of unknown function (DUF3761)